MKFLTVMLLAIFSFFSNQKTPNSNIPRYANNIQSENGKDAVSNNNQCKAVHVNPADPQAFLPDPNCTPGAINAGVTQANIHATICVAGYTKSIRPPVSYTETLKHEQIKDYGYTDTYLSDYEEDHFIPLEIGGNPTDPKNLWPEPHASPNEKDLVEDYLNKQVCNGKMSLAQAQDAIAKNWYTIYEQIK